MSAETAPDAQVTAAILADINLQIAAAKNGSEARLSATRLLAAESIAIYGADSEAAKSAALKVVEAERDAAAERERIAAMIAGYKLKVEQDRYEETKRLAKQEVEDLKKNLDDAIRASEEASATEVKLAQLDLDRKKVILDQEVAAHKLSKQGELKAEQDFENQRYALEIKSLTDQLSIAQATGELATMQKLFDEEEIAAAKHALNMETITKTGIANQQASWTSFFNTITSGFSKSISGLLTGTDSWAKATSQLTQSVAKSFADLGAKNIATMLQ